MRLLQLWPAGVRYTQSEAPKGDCILQSARSDHAELRFAALQPDSTYTYQLEYTGRKSRLVQSAAAPRCQAWHAGDDLSGQRLSRDEVRERRLAVPRKHYASWSAELIARPEHPLVPSR